MKYLLILAIALVSINVYANNIIKPNGPSTNNNIELPSPTFNMIKLKNGTITFKFDGISKNLAVVRPIKKPRLTITKDGKKEKVLSLYIYWKNNPVDYELFNMIYHMYTKDVFDKFKYDYILVSMAFSRDEPKKIYYLWFARNDLQDFEKGKLSGKTFIDRVSKNSESIPYPYKESEALNATLPKPQ